MNAAKPPTCVMCERPVGAKGVTYKLTERERHIMQVLLTDDGDVHYCRACDHLSKDPKAFAEFMRGYWLTKMRAAGVPLPIAEQRAQKAHDTLLAKALKPAS
jgi:hypothetical protein